MSVTTPAPAAGMTLVEHLAALRTRVTRALAALVVGLFVGGPVIFTQLWRFITPDSPVESGAMRSRSWY